MYAQLTKFVGPSSIVETARELGIRSKLPAYFSIGLGVVAVNPLDMTRAYATIANDGKRVDGSIMGDVPRVVQEVRFRRSGKSRPNEPVGPPVLPPAEAEQLTSILSRVVEQGRGSARSFRDARLPARPARTTTTATPGSSATHPSWRSRSGSATRTSSSRWRPSSTASRWRAGRCPR